MKIEILGTGCVRCKRLEKNVRKAVKETGVKAEIVRVDDISKILEYGVMTTPALFIDGEAKVVGGILSVGQIKELIK